MSIPVATSMIVLDLRSLRALTRFGRIPLRPRRIQKTGKIQRQVATAFKDVD